MPARLTYPGVYVEEQSSGVRTITGVATSTTLFIGMARRGVLGRPTAIRSLDQFNRIFGDTPGYGELTSQIRQFFLNGGGEAIVTRIAGPGIGAASVTLLDANGAPALELTAKSAGTLGSELRVIVDYDTPTPELTFNMEIFRRSVDANGATVISENEPFDDLSMNPASPRYVVDLLTRESTLIDAALPGPAPAPTDAGFSQSALILDAADPGAVASLNAALATGTAITVSVDGGAPVTALLPAPVGALAGWLTGLGDAITAALVAGGQPGSVTASLEAFGTTGRALRLTSSGGSVVVTPAPNSDVSRALELGSASGGVEIGRYSRFRPQPSGYTTGLHTLGADFASNADFDRLIRFGQGLRANLNGWSFDDGTGNPVHNSPAAPPFAGAGTSFLTGDSSTAGVGSLRNTTAHLDTLAASLAAGLGRDWTVRRTGYRLVLTPNFGSSNVGAAAALNSTGGLDIGAANGMAEAVNGANAQAYALGASGTGSFQTPGAPGNDGGVPTPGDYEAVYVTASREIDIFNLLVLPRGDGQTDVQRALLWGAASAFCQRENAFLIVDPPRDWATVDEAAAGIADLRMGVVTDHAAIYWPRIRVAAVNQPIDPAGTVAGIMARTDTRRGVWKAPAGLEASIIGLRGLEHRISDAENGVTNPLAINTLRSFAGGSVIWGARTMAGFDNSGENDYKYVPVRRMALFIKESLYRGLQFAIFEPNDERLWGSIRLAAGAFMQNLFRQGAFQGTRASEAYDVRCDATTTTQNDINLGRVNVIVAFAPLRPTEFVVLVIRQLAGQVQV